MLRIEILTNALVDADKAGEPLAAFLRILADRIEADISIVPGESGEWVTETYRHASRIRFKDFQGDPSEAFMGAVYTIEGE
jgi:hypothetical protein